MSSSKPDTSPLEAAPQVVEECRAMAERWAPLLHALAHPERLLIVLWLANNRCSVRDLERVTGMRQSLVSYHLRALREAGLVRATAIGRTNVYELADSDLDRVAALLGTLPPE
jgi:DNA-binding transcriptional ArsR family regulator